LLFIACESDIELLTYLNNNFKNNFQVYSSTFCRLNKLSELIKKKFQCDNSGKRISFIDTLELAYSRVFQEKNNVYDTYIFLDETLDHQAIRKIKDIITKHHLNFDYTVNLIFVSQTVTVPPELERFSEVLSFDLPDERALREKSDELASKDQLDLSGENAPSEEVLSNLRGMTLFEVEQAYTQSWKIYGGRIDLDFIREFKKASIAKTNLLSLEKSNVSFDDIGGLSTLKAWIKKCYGGWTIEGRKFGLPLLKGLLMVGLPGCGKSLICKSIGNSFGLPVVRFDPSRIFSSMVGISENNMHRVLKIIERISPCVLFIDEIEKAFAGSQSSTFSDAGVTSRVIMQFLIWMQESTAPVFTVATSNNIQYLPPEMISRFDETFFVNLPQDFERKEIFKIHIKKLGRENNFSDVDLNKLAEKSQDLSGREIEQVLTEAMYDAFHVKKDIDLGVVLNVLAKKTNLLMTMAEQLQFLIKWVGYDEERNEGIRARFASPVDQLGLNRVQDEIEKLLKDVEKKDPFGD
jgi:SpoVK/Ycf46/Vps4 family AAA+-type ATPase